GALALAGRHTCTVERSPVEPEIELAYDPRPGRVAAAAAARPRVHPRAIWLALAVTALALGDCARLVIGAEMAPREADWQAAAQAVRAGFRPGDLVVAAPAWSDPMMRLYLGDLIPVAVAARADTDRFGRAWEVSIRGAHAAETAAPATCFPVHEGRVRVRRCDKPAARVTYSLVDHLADARVVLLRGGSAHTASAQVVVGEIDYAPHVCILVEPTAPADVIRLEWPQVPLGRTLVGYTGIHSFYARKSGDGPVDVALLVGERELLRVRHRNDDGWRRFEVATAAGTAPVRFDISSPAPKDRKLCLAAEARE
ncbi:MAG TPA: hypothetical protein VKN99_12400, partial [Polyangia bacterium]|nr:hypothetical protein [Polyangia bacterium]